ncbi:LysM peptidoglycan-binding domain-containing protein [Novosphingobium rosa]|uniref:LysM peptidoglycan-binding domain-containing protein n=1 Tax=Novosphingobium rosa TaxID=76978 RepID=UPI00082D1070|nr:LysM domain-containing protein [Novosphingobium rosa]
MIRRLAGQGAAAFLLALSVAGCSHDERPKTVAPPVLTVTPERIDAIQTSLLAGDRKGADKQLKALQKLEPMNPRLQLLADSLDKDPQELLGPKSYPYTVQPGETITDVAERLLGNRLKAYQLARYNQLATPVALTAGQVLRIPGELPVARPQPTAPAPERPRRPAPAAKPAPAATAKPAANPAAAQHLRALGLAALNRGAVGEAVGLLRKARALDPGNALIARDLGRAERIEATVRANAKK